MLGKKYSDRPTKTPFDTKTLSGPIAMYDYICIGTSPLMSLEAAHHASLDKKVLMVDQSHTIGGAWKNINFAKMCKIISINRSKKC